MKLNHIDLQVVDVQAAVLFFERCLGFTLESNRSSPAIAILGDGDGFVLVLQRSKDGLAPVYPDGFHVGCLVDTVDEVHAFHAKAKSEGVGVSDVQHNGRGTLTYCNAPGGVLVEVSCQRKRA
jgi:catechol 2,3-dioxygenase-like lactoylglutathione lyase family enzyme